MNKIYLGRITSSELIINNNKSNNSAIGKNQAETDRLYLVKFTNHRQSSRLFVLWWQSG